MSYSYFFIFITFQVSLNYLYFESGAMVLVLVSLGKYIESIAIDSTTKSIKDLVKFLPKTGNLLKDYPDMTEVKINIDDIKKDDILLVKEGDTIPCDGIVIDGTADVDESLLTGESLYASKNNDSTIPHGTQIILKPDTSIFEDTAFSKEKLLTWLNDNYSDLKDKVRIN